MMNLILLVDLVIAQINKTLVNKKFEMLLIKL